MASIQKGVKTDNVKFYWVGDSLDGVDSDFFNRLKHTINYPFKYRKYGAINKYLSEIEGCKVVVCLNVDMAQSTILEMELVDYYLLVLTQYGEGGDFSEEGFMPVRIVSKGRDFSSVQFASNLELFTNAINTTIEEFLSERVNSEFLNVKTVQGIIEFKPEQKQAGIQILGFFQETLHQKYPENDITVRLSQNGNSVTMEIESMDGEIEKYEKAFAEYRLVVTGQKPVEEYLEDRINQAQLITKLGLAGAELRSTERLLGIEREKNQLLQDNLVFAQRMLESTIGGNLQLANKLGDAHIKALENQDVSKLLIQLDSILNAKGEQAARKELEQLKSKDSTIWSALVNHAYKIAEKTVYKVGSEQLIALIISVAERA